MAVLCVVALLALTDARAFAAEQLCNGLGSNCLCNEQQNGGLNFLFGGDFLDFTDSTSAKECWPAGPVNGENFCNAPIRNMLSASSEAPFLPPGHTLANVFHTQGVGICHVGSQPTVDLPAGFSYCMRAYRRWDQSWSGPRDPLNTPNHIAGWSGPDQQKILTISGTGRTQPNDFITIQMSLHTGGIIGTRFDGNFFDAPNDFQDIYDFRKCQGNYCRFEACMDVSTAGVGRARFRVTRLAPGPFEQVVVTKPLGQRLHPEGVHTNPVPAAGEAIFCLEDNELGPRPVAQSCNAYHTHYILTKTTAEDVNYWPGPACEVEGGCGGPPPILVTLSTATAGTGSGSVSGAGQYQLNTTVPVTATAASGSTFSGWSGACSGGVNPCLLLMDANKSVTATFTSSGPGFVLTTTAVGPGTVSGAGTYTPNTSVQVQATPSAHATFTGWSGACSGTTNPCTVVMSADKSVTATFTPGPGFVPIPRAGWSLAFVDSFNVGNEGVLAFDGSLTTIWHTQFQPCCAPLPHEIQINLGAVFPITAFQYTPRQDLPETHGRIGQYEFYVSTDGVTWGTPVATGTFANDASAKLVPITAKDGRFVRLRALTEVAGLPFTSAADLDVLTGSPPAQTFPCANPSQVSVHNQVHLFGDGGVAALPYTAQMGFDYSPATNARTAGVRRILNLDTQQAYVRVAFGEWESETPMDAATRATYDQIAAIRDNTQTDPAFRYWINWVFSSNQNPGKSRYAFTPNFARQGALDDAVTWFQNNIVWSDYDMVFLDQVNRDLPFWNINSAHDFASAQNLCCIPSSQNTNQNQSMDQGHMNYRVQLRDLVRAHGLAVSGNPYIMAQQGQEVHANAPLDHYYNESGIQQDASLFGIVPANLITYQLLHESQGGNLAVDGADYAKNLAVAGLAAAQGGWFGSYGGDRFWIYDPATFTTIRSGNMAVKLLRALPNWDNLIGATNRSWTGAVYSSTNSYADSNIVLSRHGKTNKIFVVWRNAGATFQLRSGETVTGVQIANGFFVENGNAVSQVTVNGSTVSLTGAGQVGAGYIITTANGCSTTPPPQPDPPTPPTNFRFGP